ncbi:hypothetical protein Vadar_012719 [Vaccinium darrowii]|uniref:Uncharacterized protein n=1 Tax=Vaccinium darrowii TaxID=229202 RepID=A0ACB7YEM6_9ERIC|nr:hypothetical protein Vadar_012719 [Vaccinium darrowii]
MDQIKPAEGAFVSLWSHRPSEYEDLESMVCDFALDPTAEHYSCLIDLLCRVDEVEKEWKDYVMKGNIEIGSLREVDVKSGLPTKTITEKLELLDDEEHSLASGLSVATKATMTFDHLQPLHDVYPHFRDSIGDALGTANVIAAMLGLSTLCISFYSLGLWGSFYAN